MTTFTAFQSVSLTPALIGAAVSALTGHPSLLVHNGTEFEVKTATAELDIHGIGFTYPFGPSYGPSTGTITTLELSLGSSYVPAYEFTGLAIPAHQLQLDVIQGNLSAVFALFVHGHERINGSPFADHLYDFGGFDSVTGGAGNDIMSGGHGYDRFNFHANFGQDVITHFRSTGANHDTRSCCLPILE
jgi:Ca2+-binding RTX toxin-like protein